MRALNFDINAGATPLPEVLEAVRSLPAHAQNPSSIHQLGQRSRAMLEAAREEVLSLLGVTQGQARVIFTSGATESNNTVLLGACLHGAVSRSRGVVSTAVEHQSVLGPLSHLKTQGIPVTLLPIESGEGVDLAPALSLPSDSVTLGSIMLANNESGHVFPVGSLGAALRERHPKIFLHTDAVQALGKIEVNFFNLGVDALSLSGHKLGALTGIGALVIREDHAHFPLLMGGAQELRHRGGTENVPGIVSLGVAARVVRESLQERKASMKKAVDFLRKALLKEVPRVKFNSPEEGGIPNTLSVTIPGSNADDLVVAADLEGLCISSGAACSSGKPLPSHVLCALGLSEEEARSTVRISVEPHLSEADLSRGADILIACIKRMRSGL